MRGLIFLSGETDKQLALQEAGGTDIIIAADGGLLSARKCGIEPHVLIGDFDSLPAEELSSFAGEMIRLNIRKDETDGQAALDLLLARGCDDIILLGGMGGRMDHQLSHLALLMRAFNRGARARLLDGVSAMECFGPSYIHIDGKVGDIISLIPLSGAYIMNTAGLEYPLRYSLLKRDEVRGISNVLTHTHAVIEMAGGAVALIHTRLD